MRVVFAEPLQHHRSHFRISLIGIFFTGSSIKRLMPMIPKPSCPILTCVMSFDIFLEHCDDMFYYVTLYS